MQTTITVAGNLHISPFDMFAQDTDEVIMLLNYYLNLAETDGETSELTTDKQMDKSFWSAL